LCDIAKPQLRPDPRHTMTPDIPDIFHTYRKMSLCQSHVHCIINGVECLKVTLADSLDVRYITVYVNLPYFRRWLCLLLLDLI
jgi:hypothetical protein